MHGKNYYLAPAYPMLFAAGGAGFERILALRFRWLKPAIAFLVVVSAVVLAPVVLPILSPEKLLAYMRAIHFEVPRTETSHTAALPQLYADQFSLEDRGLIESSPWAMPWEQRQHILVCRDLKIPLRELWPKVQV